MTSVLFLLSSTPAPSATNVAVGSNIVLNFNEAVSKGKGQLTIFDSLNRVVLQEDIATSTYFTVSGSTITLDPPANFGFGANYRVVIPEGFALSIGPLPFKSDAATLAFTAGLSAVAVNLMGTAEAELMHGSELNDVLNGAGGADNLYGYSGNDQLEGGDGDDYLVDIAGNNTLSGGAGNDTLQGGSSGTSVMSGGAGVDTLLGGNGNDTMQGGDGDDRITLTPQVNGLANTINVDGGAGNDVIAITFATGRATTVNAAGGAGSDTHKLDKIHSGSTYTISDFAAGAGGDVLDITALIGADWDNGNPFNSAIGRLRLQQRGADTVLQLDADGLAALASFEDMVVLKNVTASNFVAGNIGPAIAPDGSPVGSTINGTTGSDNITGSFLADTINGGDGSDTIDARGGDDKLNGGAGADYLFGLSGNDQLRGDGGDDDLDGGQGDDQLFGGDGNDTVRDATGNNQLYGEAGDDKLNGTDGNALYGGEGNDQLFGGSLLDAGNGNDTLTAQLKAAAPGQQISMLGGAGDDVFHTQVTLAGGALVTATGGAGRDVFSLGSAADTASYTVTDFNGDAIAVTALVAPGVLSAVPANPFASGMLSLLQSGQDTLLQYRPSSTEPLRTLLTLQNTAATAITSNSFVERINPNGSQTGSSVNGDAQANTLVGGWYNDGLDGGAGNDKLQGGQGNDLLTGGEGKDSAIYLQNRSAYTLTRSGAQFSVNGSEGIDTLNSVERLKFADTMVALDVDGNAGQVYRLYQAAFDRVPDKAGLGYWIGISDAGAPLSAVNASFVRSAEFIKLYGANPTSDELVSRYYENVLNRQPDGGGKAYWIDLLERNILSAGDVLGFISESPENIAAVGVTINNGFEYQLYGQF